MRKLIVITFLFVAATAGAIEFKDLILRDDSTFKKVIAGEYDTTAPKNQRVVFVNNTTAYTGAKTHGAIFSNRTTMYYVEGTTAKRMGSGSSATTTNNYYSSGSGQAISEITGATQSIRNGNLYVMNSATKATYRNHSSGRTSIYANYSTRLVPDSGSRFWWRNPSTFDNNSTAAGYSVKIPAGTWVDIVSYGSPIFQVVMTTQNLIKTGTDEYYTAEGGQYLATADFEGSGINGTGGTWGSTNNSGTVDSDSTATVLAGNQSAQLVINSDATVPYIYSPNLTYSGTLYGYLEFELTETFAGNTVSLVYLVDTDGPTDTTAIARIAVNTSGGLLLYHGTANDSTAGGTITINTHYYLWWDYTAGTGSNGTANAYLSTTSTKPGSANITLTNGTGTALAQNVLFRGGYNHTAVYDHILLSITAIGSAP